MIWVYDCATPHRMSTARVAWQVRPDTGGLEFGQRRSSVFPRSRQQLRTRLALDDPVADSGDALRVGDALQQL